MLGGIFSITIKLSIISFTTGTATVEPYAYDLDGSSTTTRTAYFGSLTGKVATKMQTFLLVYEPFKAL